MKICTLLLATLLASCASHNSHLVHWTEGPEAGELLEQALEDLESRLRGGLPEQLLLVADVQELEVSFAFGPDDQGSLEQFREWVEGYMQQRLGDALVLAPTSGDFWEAAPHMLQMKILLDLHRPDELGAQAQALLVERARPERAKAAGWSDIHIMERPYCHGCRDWSFREKGSKLSFAQGTSEGFLYLGPYSVFHSSRGVGHYPSVRSVPRYRVLR